MNRGASERLRIGMIAPEFPPEIGGMHTLARGFAETLAQHHDVTVYTPREQTGFPGSYRQSARFSNHLGRDRAALAGEAIDVWLGMNAGLLPLLSRLPGHVFCYVHGKDFLTPWIAYGPRWMDTLRRPHLPAVRKAMRRRALVAHRDGVRHYFTNSGQTAALARNRLGITAEDITVCPPGVDEQFFQAKAVASRDHVRLITVSRLTRFTRRKNVDGVLRAVAELQGKMPIDYVVVGDGDDREVLERTAQELGIGHLVSFKGSLSNEELRRAYADADLFVLASKATPLDFEGFGIVYLEASASGLPVLCSAEGGATDAVEDGWNGILVKDSAPATIAAGVRRFVAERDRFPEDRVRSWAERFRWPEVTAQLEAAIRQYL